MPFCSRKKCCPFPIYRCPPYNRPCPPGFRPPRCCKSYGLCCPPACCGSVCIPPSCQPPLEIQGSLCCDPCSPPLCTPLTVCPQLIRPCGKPICPSGKRFCRRKRYPMDAFEKRIFLSQLDKRIYRNGEHLGLSYAGHIPGEVYVFGRTLPVATTFAKRRLCTYTPYEYVDHDGCCSFPGN